jgi:hypothetical protein
MDAQNTKALQPGMEVQAADGEKVGRIVETHPDYVVVEKGLLFPTDHYVPVGAIAGIGEDGTVRLAVTRDEVVNQGWENPPASLVGGTSPGLADDSYDPTYAPHGDLTAAGREAVDRATGAAEAEVGRSDEAAGPMGGGAGTAGRNGHRAAEGEFAAFVRAAEPAMTAGITGTTAGAATAAIASMPGFTGEVVSDGTGPEDADAFSDEMVEIPLRESRVEGRE